MMSLSVTLLSISSCSDVFHCHHGMAHDRSIKDSLCHRIVARVEEAEIKAGKPFRHHITPCFCPR